VDAVVPAAWTPTPPRADYRLSDEPFEEFFSNFYMTDPISRASKTMAECARMVLGPQKKAA
jgi:NADH-quinone oxidoreductase subunit G